ncbi:hypothetical protein C8R45DRAFT_1208661 [Mycena sanguinolenta]|nr:hypothetical protein C8R45DRAFT_1208661 [Mycena sanguinolenta]
MPSLPDLPPELLIEIVGHYSPLITGVLTNDRFSGNNALHHGRYGLVEGLASELDGRKELFAGNNALRALSQTCRHFRGIFLPVLWARAHACFTPWNRSQKKWNWLQKKTRTRGDHKMLMRRMIGMQKTPYIHPYIRSLTVTLAECVLGNKQNKQPIAEFVRVLDLLSNLKDLTILSAPSNMVPVLSTACQGKVFPSVERLGLEDGLAPIIPCFPNLHTVTFIWGWPGPLELLVAIKAHCPHIHTVNNFPLSLEEVNCLRSAVPNVRRISLWVNHWENLSLFEGMNTLSELHIYNRPTKPFVKPFNDDWQPPSAQDIVAAAKRVLHTSKTVEPKTLRFYEFSDRVVRPGDVASRLEGSM